jgi:hypothetical protein
MLNGDIIFLLEYLNVIGYFSAGHPLHSRVLRQAGYNGAIQPFAPLQ